MKFLKLYRIHIAWTLAVIATAGSLSFSKVFGFIPCELCWYQRILMYPLVIILGVGIFNIDIKILKKFVLPFTFLGLLVSLYHTLEQKIAWLGNITPCTQGVPCSIDYLNWFNFITIPMLAFVVFLLISILMLVKE